MSEDRDFLLMVEMNPEKPKSTWREKLVSFGTVVRVLYIIMRFGSAFTKYKKIRDFVCICNQVIG